MNSQDLIFLKRSSAHGLGKSYVMLNNLLSRCRFDSQQDLWVVRHVNKALFLATSKAPEESYLLGAHTWTIYNDSRACSPTGVILTQQSLEPI